MSHTMKSQYFHLIWSTKNRINWITPDIQPRLYAYIGGLIRGHNNSLLCIGGTENHVHLLISFKNIDRFSSMMRDYKSKSTIWLRDAFPHKKNFTWQIGYGAFSTSYSGLDKVMHYIENQEEHHKKISFEQEFEMILEKHNIKMYQKENI